MASRAPKAFAERASFFSAVKDNKWSKAWAAYHASSEKKLVDKFMLSALVGLTARTKPEKLSPLWRSLQKASAMPLDAHHCSDFITAFGRQGDLAASKQVLDTACARGLANTRVYNAYLRACSHASRNRSSSSSSSRRSSSSSSDALGMPSHAALDPLTETERVLAAMEVSDHALPDAYTCSLAAGILGRAGKLHDVAALVARAGNADTVAHNALIDAAARAGAGHEALAILQRMEASGPPPDEVSYASALHALVSVPSNAWGGGVDRVALAEDLRQRMGARGLEENAASKTLLYILYADSPLSEELFLA